MQWAASSTLLLKNVTKAWTGSASVGFTAHDKSTFGNGHHGNFFVSGPLVQDKLGLQVYGGADYRPEDNIIGGSNRNKNRNINVKLSFTPTDKQTFILEGGRHRIRKYETPGKSLALTTTRGTSVAQNQPGLTRATRNHWSLTHPGRLGCDEFGIELISRKSKT